MARKRRGQSWFSRALPVVGGLLFAALTLYVQESNQDFVRAFRDRLDWLVYDLRLNQTLPEKPAPRPDVVILDIDEASLAKEGQWPWPRARIADLIDRLGEYGMVVVAFDVVFAEAEENIARHALREIAPHLDGETLPVAEHLLETAAERVDGDRRFAESIARAAESGMDVVLGYTMSHEPNRVGVTGVPLELGAVAGDPDLVVIDMAGYTANLPQLQQATEFAGFFVANPDSDGVNRRYPLILRLDGEIYPSLALAAARRFLFSEEVGLRTAPIGGIKTIEAVTLDGVPIPTDGSGYVLIPYHGGPKTVRYISIGDVLDGSVDPALLEGRIGLVGTSAAGLVDVRSTPVSSVFPGVEIHANVIGGIIDQQFPYRPPWTEGADFMLTVGVGLLLAVLLPFLSVTWLVLVAAAGVGGLLWLNLWLWIEHGFDISLVGPVFAILAISAFNLIYGFFTESRQKRQLKGMFGQYVPPQLVDEMSDIGIDDTAELREMTVLFCDIRGFTSISEQLTATELADMLNRFFTPMTEIIFNHKGTIDKYVGDMIMAFWNAPLHDPDHAVHAIETALAMLEQVEVMRPELQALGYPEVNIGIGLNTGPMNVGNMGSQFRRAYTVLGDAVNLGSRLEGLTKQYGVKLIVGETTRAGRDEFVYRSLDRVTVKGKKEPTRIFEPVCRRDVATSELMAEIDAYDAARQLYYEQQWDAAEAAFRELNSRHQVFVYGLYIDRITHMREAPPGPDWDGVFVHTSK